MATTGTLRVSWRGKVIEVTLEDGMTIGELKASLRAKTGVPVGNQKLMGFKAIRGLPKDDALVASHAPDPARPIMMMGSPDADHVPPPPEGAPGSPAADDAEVVNDLDDMDPTPAAASRHVESIAQRVASYKPTVLSAPRDGKACLVLDMDYTLFDHRSSAEDAGQLARPHLHEFLEAAHASYDIFIWSATSLAWIVRKMRALGIADHPRYQVTAIYCERAMVTVATEKYGVLNVKPLAVIWGQFEGRYSPRNTVHVDDLSRNFTLNPQSGLKIPPCAGMPVAANRAKDRELVRLTRYLSAIADSDFSTLDHSKWHKVVRGLSHEGG
mmetsp:Transcript_24725/g.82939  ORF Transcript_24725/g.82939 Transcript_24725/m.82939 type:complete len:327 (+) Transcript_24725:153-1133(+)